MAGEDPVAELAADGEDLAEEPLLLEHLDLPHARQPELVLHDAVLQPGVFAQLGQAQRFGGGDGRRLLAVDRFPRLHGLLDEARPLQCAGGVEEDLVVGVAQRAVEIGRVLQRLADRCSGRASRPAS